MSYVLSFWKHFIFSQVQLENSIFDLENIYKEPLRDTENKNLKS